MIEVRGLSKIYSDGTTALRQIDLGVQAGEFVGLMGRSGAGKTTLFRLLNGTLRPNAGYLRVLEQSVPTLRREALRTLRRQIGFIYQQHGLVPSLSVLHNVLLGRAGSLNPLTALLRLSYVPAHQVHAVAASLHELGVDVPLRRVAGDLSGGQQQRIAVARALWQAPRLLLADEPVASVDVETAEAIMQALSHRNQRDGLTILVALHQPEIARRYCRRVILLDRGEIRYDGPPERVRSF
jgi:phosphonate transport system ATP-binding protein